MKRPVRFLMAAAALSVVSGSALAASASSAAQVSPMSATESQCAALQSEYTKFSAKMPVEVDATTDFVFAAAQYRDGTDRCHVTLHYEVSAKGFLAGAAAHSKNGTTQEQIAEFYRTKPGIETLERLFREKNEGIYRQFGMDSDSYEIRVIYAMDSNELPDLALKLY